MNTSITAIDGIRVGHYTDQTAKTGCTAILFDGGAVCGVDVRGAAPGTRETDLLKHYSPVEKVNAVLLTGGSAYGLNAAGGVMEYLEERSIGNEKNGIYVPIVPAAVIYDLAVGDSKTRPGIREGYAACQNASSAPVSSGPIGAGTGATIGKCLGKQYAVPGGIGNAVVRLPDGILVAALLVVNALGDVYAHHTGQILAGASKDGTLLNCMDTLLHGTGESGFTNTTIGLIATNAKLTREEANRLALIGHDGLAMSIRPVHTPSDGDTLFAASVGDKVCGNMLALFAAAAEAAALAAEDAVRHKDAEPANT